MRLVALERARREQEHPGAAKSLGGRIDSSLATDGPLASATEKGGAWRTDVVGIDDLPIDPRFLQRPAAGPVADHHPGFVGRRAELQGAHCQALRCPGPQRVGPAADLTLAVALDGAVDWYAVPGFERDAGFEGCVESGANLRHHVGRVAR